ncbi:hypothetical protein SAMN03159371_07459 [Variovorax sp. NFACC28]|nr:hypothetical protein SAMN03159371_07459 [Variovorax sp. NFACC28]SEG98743.1 hypothetical protein SAMN03159365_07333 [Variovorax sp. NFACC29]SFE14815.1 hypothetical protein SAMN03159379_07400 [Variovorax sp. NFACC26]SFH19414.1 hypothetical protein SAMN03159447_07153 [Variovorax sp. NFACC27]
MVRGVLCWQRCRPRCIEFAELSPGTSEVDLFDDLLFHNVFLVEHLLLNGQTADSLLRKLPTGNRMVSGARHAFFEMPGPMPASRAVVDAGRFSVPRSGAGAGSSTQIPLITASSAAAKSLA